MSLSGGQICLAVLVGLLSFPDIQGQQCGVTYPKTLICALSGSTILLQCRHIQGQACSSESRWFNGQVDLFQDPRYTSRAFVSGPECTFQVKGLMEGDSGIYYLAFKNTNAWTPVLPGVNVSVTDRPNLEVSPGSVREGQRVTLTCSTTCTLSNNPTYIWYKNGQPVSDKHTTRDNRLYLNSCSREDAGSYSCASPEVPLRVESSYPPSFTYAREITSEQETITEFPTTYTTPLLYEEVTTTQMSPTYSTPLPYEETITEFPTTCTTPLLYEEASVHLILIAVVAAVVVVFILVLVILQIVRMNNCTSRLYENNPGEDRQHAIDDPNGPYTALNLRTRSPEYDTLFNVRNPCSENGPHSDYENI
ncbi:uncharacterized protein LOC114786761 isoform X2 [Denticeps clupeoides]|uniref:uncharacterized protein LOC114786761 isoform X2 n=1 Tax=Denticeps clupeoides TaxID=299321 RepID=UPI0010A39A9E|nr:uncharacterized protein LOC114786761 isoform X2 [Denticeps clupeoides]